jgi:hypothetical protein
MGGDAMTGEQRAKREVNQGMTAFIILGVIGYQAFVYFCGLATGIH